MIILKNEGKLDMKSLSIAIVTLLSITLLFSTPATAEEVDCELLMKEIKQFQVAAQRYRRLMEDGLTEGGQVYVQSKLHKERLEAERGLISGAANKAQIYSVLCRKTDYPLR